MPESNNITGYYDFSSSALTTQSILDVFVLQDLIDQVDADRLHQKFRTNREIEDFLVKNRIVTKDTINKAYSIILKMPYVEIKSIEIAEDLKNLIPEKIVRKYGIIPFGVFEQTVRIAISRPADLLVGYKESLSKLFSDKKLDIELFITGETDFDESVKQYNKKYKAKLLLKKGRLPIVFLRNQIISKNYLNKIPQDFIQKYRIAVFGISQKGFYLVACEQPDSPTTLKILDFIKRENGIKFEVFATSKEDIDYVLEMTKPEIDPSADLLPIIQEEKPEEKPETIPEKPKEKPIVKKTPSSGSKSVLKGLLDSFMGSSGSELTVDSVQEEQQGVSAFFDKDEKESAKEEDKEEKTEERPIETQKIKETDKNESNSVEIEPEITENPKVQIQSEIEPSIQTDNKKEPEVLKVEMEVEKPVINSNVDVDMESALNTNDLGALLPFDVKDEKNLEEVAKSNSVPKTVAAIIDFALNNRSSDIHVEPEAKILRIRCRVDGVLRDILKLPIGMHAAFVSRIKIMSKLKIDESRIPQDGRFDTLFNKREVDVRVSTLPTVHGEKIVMRVLDKSQGILSLEDLGMKGSAFDKTMDAIAKPYGIILATGPTGSGKSTTLYAVLNRISVPGVNIVTLEDPVEYEIVGINQCQIKPEIGFTFAAGLRSILRQDPNVIMVGEIRDAETASMATHAALTGHLVLSTLHTNDTAGALPRMINMGVEPFLITSSINLVLAQRLVRRICPKCKEEVNAPQKLMDQIKEELDKIPANNTKDRERIPSVLKLYHGKGCPECNLGFKGRVGLYEAMTINPEIEDLAVAKQPANEIKEASIKDGMITMKQDGILKAVEGLTTIDEVFQAVVSN